MIGRRSKWSDNIKGGLKFITVEPMVSLYIMGSVVANLATQNLNLEKACRVNMGYGDEVCTALERRETANYTLEEETVQKLVASMTVWQTLVHSSIPALLILFLGGWSDRHGRRKPLMLFPIVGELLSSLGLIVNTLLLDRWPMEVAGITEAIFPALSGGWMTMFMAVYSYIEDNTDLERRTLRIGLLHTCTSVSVPLGMSLSGLLYNRMGFYGVFSLSCALYLLSFSYGLAFIKDRNDRSATRAENKADESRSWSWSCRHTFGDFFQLDDIKQTLAVCFKQGSNRRRKKVLSMMIVVVVVMGPLHGEMTVMYLFTRYRFNWDEVDFSIFSTYSMLTNLIGTLVSVVVFSHILKIDDALIGVMSCMSKILAGFVYAFATTTFVIYLAPLVDIVNGTSFIAMRSIVSKLVPNDELGKINSMIGLAESVVPVIYGPMYSAVYAATMQTMPGTFFLLGGALTFPAVLIFLWMYGQHRGDRRRQKLAQQVESNKIDNISSKLTGIDNAAFLVA